MSNLTHFSEDEPNEDRGSRAFTRTNAPAGAKVIQLDQIITSLKDMQRTNFTKETEWLFEKSQMNSKVTQLESQLQAQQNINEDLIRRIKMLEFCLREERIKYARLMQTSSGNGGSAIKDGDAPVNIIDSVLEKANLNATLYERIAKRRAKAQRPLLLKFLQEVGYEDIFNTNEVNEIKELYNRAQSELTDSINQANSLHTAKLEEKLLADDSLKNKLKNRTTLADDQDFDNGADEAKTGTDAKKDANKQVELSKKYELKSHMDIIRGVTFIPSIDVMATISEDCMVKVWNLSDLDRQYTEASSTENIQMQPYLTLRGHTGPILCSTSIQDAQRDSQNRNMLFTAGIEGNIIVWNIPKVSDVQQYGNTQDGKNFCVAIWADPEQEQEAIWGVQYHSFQDKLISLNANNSIVLWNCENIPLDRENPSSSGNILHRFQYSSGGQEEESATSIAWLQTQQNQFVVGYDTGMLVFFDIISASLASAQSVNTPHINKVQAHPSRSLVFTGHENGTINVFDYSSDQVVKTLAGAHSDAISCMGVANSGLQLVSGSHDCTLKVWDLRRLEQNKDQQDQAAAGAATEPLFTIQAAHQKKYDEGVQGLAIHPTQPFVATGGADSIAKVFELFA